MRRVTPQKLLSICMIVVFVLLVLPLYAVRGLNDSMDHARGTGTVGGIDFKAYYIAADMLRSGQDFYDVRLQAEEVQARGLPPNESFYIYPPLLAIIFLPLTALPLQRAAQVWFFLNMGVYGLSLVVIARALNLHRRSGAVPILLVLAFLFPPALFTLYKGQINMVVLLLLAVTLWLYLRNRQLVAGATLAVASMIKVIPVLLLPYFVWRKRYVLSLAAATTMVAVAIFGLVIVGWGPHWTFLSSVLPSLAQPRPNPGNQSLGGFLGLLLIENPYVDNIAHDPSGWRIATITASAVVVAGVVLTLWRRRASAVGTDLEFALIVAVLPLLANIAWVDLFVVLVIPYAVLLSYVFRHQIRKPWIFAATASVVCISFPRLQDLFTNLVTRYEPFLRNPLIMGLPLYGLVLLCVATAGTLWEAPAQESHHAAD